MPVVKTKGSASSQGFGEFAQQGGGDANWIDDVFSTYLYTGNGSTQTITNGIDLATDGGLVWLKYRSGGGNPAGHFLYTPQLPGSGGGYYYKNLQTNNTNAAGEGYNDLTAFNSNGFSLGGNTEINYNNDLYTSWTFAKQEKFFDIVTYTGNGVGGRTVAHNLGSAPGCVIVKCTSNSADWRVWHRGTSAGNYLTLNSTDAQSSVSAPYFFGNDSTTIDPNSTTITLGSGGAVNNNGWTYVAYLFAHDAGGFGTAGTDNVISCGSYTGNGSSNGPVVTLGYEPQWVMIKRTDSTGSWFMHDVMRGMPITNSFYLRADTSGAETEGGVPVVSPTATGFQLAIGAGSWNASGGTYIYIAIRRPMKPPTTGTEVFSPIISNSAQDTKLTTNFVVDAQLLGYRTGSVSSNWTMYDRLRGVSSNTSGGAFPRLITSGSAAEDTSGGVNGWDNTGFRTSGAYASINAWYANFRRAPGFFDEVCYTGTGSATAFNHNLTVVPELIIIKKRSAVSNWFVGYNFTASTVDEILLDSNAASDGTYNYNDWFGAAPTSTTFTPYVNTGTNSSTYVAYLFATVAGVSKVGSYTGTGTVTQTINAGFGASGARWVLIKRTDASGGWYVFDTARGFTSSSSPYLLLNSTAAEVTGNNGCYAASTGFTLDTNASATVNINGASYIYLSVA